LWFISNSSKQKNYERESGNLSEHGKLSFYVNILLCRNVTFDAITVVSQFCLFFLFLSINQFYLYIFLAFLILTALELHTVKGLCM